MHETSLDELPQLFNVIKGEMSLVGSRPIVDKKILKYGEYDYYLVRPGITGYWQVSGRNEIEFEGRLHLDISRITHTGWIKSSLLKLRQTWLKSRLYRRVFIN